MLDPPVDRIGVADVIGQEARKQVQGGEAEIHGKGRVAPEQELARSLAEHPPTKGEQDHPQVKEALSLLHGLDGKGEDGDECSQQQQRETEEEGWPLLELG